MFELAGYETIKLIGEGGFGKVWLATQLSTGREVAVKVGHSPIIEETLQIRFEREYKALGRLSGHSNVVDIITAGTLPDERPYLVLEFIDGGTLWDYSQAHRVDEADLIQMGAELAKALKAAHMSGVLHRDIKPENVLLRSDGEAVLSDFGLAQLKDGSNTTSDAVVASVAYAAPETLRGERATAATDIYGLGVCLLTAAIQSVPFVTLTDKTIQPVIKRVVQEAPPDLSQLGYSELFSDLIARLLSKDPKERPSGAVEAARKFEELPEQLEESEFSWQELLGEPESEPVDEPDSEQLSLTSNLTGSSDRDDSSGYIPTELLSKSEANDTPDQADAAQEQADPTPDQADPTPEPKQTWTQPEQADAAPEPKQTWTQPEHADAAQEQADPTPEPKQTWTQPEADSQQPVGDSADTTDDSDLKTDDDPAEPADTDILTTLLGEDSGRETPPLASLENVPKQAKSIDQSPEKATSTDREDDPIHHPDDWFKNREKNEDKSNEDKGNDPKPEKTSIPKGDFRTKEVRRKRQRFAIAAAGVGCLLLVGLGYALITALAKTKPPRPPAPETDVALPLSLDVTSLPPDTVEATTPSLGPATPIFCQDAPTDEGLVQHRGTQLLSEGSGYTVEQLVAQFDDVASAEAYVNSVEATLDCQSWKEEAGNVTTRWEATKSETAATEQADDSLSFDVTGASASGPTINRTIHLVRIESRILLVTVSAEEPADLSDLEETAEQAIVTFVES